MKENEVMILPSEVQELAVRVSVDKQKEVSNVLTQIFTGTADWKQQADSIVVKDVNDKMSIQMADAGRRNVKTARLAAEKIFDAKRDEVQQIKAEYDLEDKLWLKAKQTMQLLFKDVETTFEYKAKFAERYETEQKEIRTQSRIEKVKPFAELNRFEFENMSEEMFSIFLSGIEKLYNDRIETEKKVEAERLRLIEEDRKEREWINQENERLRKENEERQKQFEIERKRQVKELAKQKAKAEFEAKKQAEIEQKERERQAKIMADQQAKAAEERRIIEEKARKEREEQAAIIIKEREAREKLQIEIQAKIDTERKAQIEHDRKEKERIDTESKAAKAPDKEKMNKWIDSLNIAVPELSNLNAMATANVISQKFEGFKNWAKQQVETL